MSFWIEVGQKMIWQSLDVQNESNLHSEEGGGGMLQ